MRLIDADELVRVHGSNKTMSQIGLMEDNTFNNGIDYMVFCINAAPTMNPIKHGHWIPGTYGTPMIPETDICSRCSKQYVYGHNFNYCPNCGAKMK